jgi:FKBP-type peptidyl-prolyl cis-trans isomerase
MKTRIALMFVLFAALYSSCKIEGDDEKLQNKENTILKNYINFNNITTQPTASGLYFISRSSGNGISPSDTGFVLVNTNWFLLDGQEKLVATNDTLLAYKKDIIPMVFYKGPIKYYIPACFSAVAEGILKMKEGDSATLITPSKLMLGSYQSATIPKYSPLRIEIKLVRVINNPVADDLASIKRYLDTLQLTEQDKTDGIYLKIDKAGEGAQIDENDTVNLTYTSRSVDSVFNLGSSKPRTTIYIDRTDSVLTGLRTALMKLREGDEARVILPYNVAYGKSGKYDYYYDAVIVPYFTSLYYTIKINHVGKN